MFKQISFLALIVALVFISCDDSQDISPTTSFDSAELTSSEDLATLEYLANDSEELVDALIETRGPGDCPEITFENPQGEFPNTLTIDFGDKCERNGHVRSGKIIVYQTAPMLESGASRTTTFENYFTDGIQHTGTKILSNTGFDADGNVTHTRFVNIELLFPNGQSASWTADYIKTQVAGAGTDIRTDDVFEIAGSATGVSRNGREFSSTITENLVRRRDCRWITDGTVVIEVIADEGTKTRTIDYGVSEESCDNLAEVTLNNGMVKIIHIHKRWW